jgi:hypothetical protein
MSSNRIDIDQKELFKNANRRLRQKKRLVHHLVFFIAGGAMLMFINLVLSYGSDFRPLGMPWYASVIIIWAVFLIAHAINVFFVEKLMGRAWEEKYMAKLVEKQLEKLKKIQQKVDKKYPLDDPASGQKREENNQEPKKE